MWSNLKELKEEYENENIDIILDQIISLFEIYLHSKYIIDNPQILDQKLLKENTLDIKNPEPLMKWVESIMNPRNNYLLLSNEFGNYEDNKSPILQQLKKYSITTLKGTIVLYKLLLTK